MRTLLTALIAAAAICPGVHAEDQGIKPVLLEKAEVLPLALGDEFAFRKTKVYLNEPVTLDDYEIINEKMVTHEQDRRMFGALTWIERQQRYGQYFTLLWHSEIPSDVDVRLEYRQAKLGPYVQAQQISYKQAKGTTTTEFQVTGDAFETDGAVISWRALLIQDGRIVALHSSYLWN